MPQRTVRHKVIGRELIDMTDEFYTQPWVLNYMARHNLTKKTFPKIVLQEAHSDHVAKLPQGATLLGTSASAQVEIYCIEDRALCFQSHPDFNSGFMQEHCQLEDYQNGVIKEEHH